MSYGAEVFETVRELYEERRRRAIESLEERSAEAQEKIPELRPIEEQLHATGVRVMEAMRQTGSIDSVKEENRRLVAKREELLLSHGFPRDYCDPRYVCPLCSDTGYVGNRECVCRKEALYRAQAEQSGLGSLLEKQTFDNFSLLYYPDREAAKETLEVCRAFAKQGYKKGENLLLMGGTGLGKTHLSTAIAGTVMRTGGSVIYESAPSIIEAFRFEQFGRSFNDRSPNRTDRYFGADLLIIDDLGCEAPGPFAVATVYNLVNTRLLSGRSVLINTNLSPSELTASYDRRITSRLLGSYTIMTLQGTDVRMQKLKNGQD